MDNLSQQHPLAMSIDVLVYFPSNPSSGPHDTMIHTRNMLSMEYSMNDIKLAIKSLTYTIDATKNQLQNHMTTINNNNNNNNLILRSRPSQTPNQCMRPPCLWDKGPPPPNHLTVKSTRVYIPYPPLDLNL
jgi:hypothetical protein